MPNGPSRNEPASRSSRLPNTLGESNARHAEPVDRAVGRDQRAGVAVGEERVVGDRRERRRRRGALRLRASAAGLAGGRAHDASTGRASRRGAATSSSAASGPHDPLRVGVDRRRRVEQRLQDPPGLLDAVLAGEARAVAVHRGVQQHLVGRRALPALLGELHVEA